MFRGGVPPAFIFFSVCCFVPAFVLRARVLVIVDSCWRVPLHGLLLAACRGFSPVIGVCFGLVLLVFGLVFFVCYLCFLALISGLRAAGVGLVGFALFCAVFPCVFLFFLGLVRCSRCGFVCCGGLV